MILMFTFLFLQAMSQSTGDIIDSVNNDYFEYVRNRFETELPDYEEAINQNKIMLWNSEKTFGSEGASSIDFDLTTEGDETDDFSDNSTIKFSGSDGETEV